MNCNKCQFVCRCCKSDTGVRCSGCEGNKDEFIIDGKWIKFCPLTGESTSESDDLKNKTL